MERILILRNKLKLASSSKQIEDVRIKLNSDKTSEGFDREQQEYVLESKKEHFI